MLTTDEARQLLNSIDMRTLLGLRDHTLIALMIYTFARVGASVGMRLEDVYVQGRSTWAPLHEKRAKQHEMPCHHGMPQAAALKPVAERCLGRRERDLSLCFSTGYAYGALAVSGLLVTAPQ